MAPPPYSTRTFRRTTQDAGTPPAYPVQTAEGQVRPVRRRLATSSRFTPGRASSPHRTGRERRHPRSPSQAQTAVEAPGDRVGVFLMVAHPGQAERVLLRGRVGPSRLALSSDGVGGGPGVDLRISGARRTRCRDGSKSLVIGVDIQPQVCVVFCSYRERQRQAGAGDDGTPREVRQDGQAGRSQSVNRFRLVTVMDREQAVKTYPVTPFPVKAVYVNNAVAIRSISFYGSTSVTALCDVK